ncbi:MAG: DUF721 domain-containing protein [Flavobacteriales bacterium]|nr:DUF721 domain-containing protein [Flavobacteriales bacterium]
MYKKKYKFTRRNEPISLSEGLKGVFSEYRIEEKLDIVEIRNRWNEIMGGAISNKTSSINLNNGILRIKITSSVLLQELSFAKDKIKSHMNAALKKEIIKEVILY